LAKSGEFGPFFSHEKSFCIDGNHKFFKLKFGVKILFIFKLKKEKKTTPLGPHQNFTKRYIYIKGYIEVQSLQG
jgi:hypothetical protein